MFECLVPGERAVWEGLREWLCGGSGVTALDSEVPQATPALLCFVPSEEAGAQLSRLCPHSPIMDSDHGNHKSH